MHLLHLYYPLLYTRTYLVHPRPHFHPLIIRIFPLSSCRPSKQKIIIFIRVKRTAVALDAAHLSEVENHHVSSSQLEGAKMGKHLLRISLSKLNEILYSNDCRFPHVLSDNTTTPTPSQLPPTRGGGPRPRGQANGHSGFPTVEAKLGAMSIRDVSVALLNFMSVQLNLVRMLHAQKTPSK